MNTDKNHSARLFDGFAKLDHTTARTRFSGVVGGKGPPILLLHGYLQSHACWHAVAPALATRHTVIVPDLPGYGNSETFDSGPWDKRSVGIELVAMMRALGHGALPLSGMIAARVGYRLTLDHPGHVRAYAALAVVPILDVSAAVDWRFAVGAFHWFLFAQPGDLPERLLASEPDAFLHTTLEQMAGGIHKLHPAKFVALPTV